VILALISSYILSTLVIQEQQLHMNDNRQVKISNTKLVIEWQHGTVHFNIATVTYQILPASSNTSVKMSLTA
jgi:hypothetical protein